MPRTFFDLNLLANMVAKLVNIVGEHVKFDMFANIVGQFGPVEHNHCIQGRHYGGVRGVPHPPGLRGCRQFLEFYAFVGKSRNVLLS